MMYNNLECNRECTTEEFLDYHEYRNPYRMDYARVIHSPSFRRLAGKTQLFPANESDFFRNRLTHSLEVAQIAKMIANKINQTTFKGKKDFKINLDIVEFAGISHDLGHPPFGHQGEEALAECMYKHGGFEGNAQTLRILSKIDKKIQNGNLERGGFDKYGNDCRFGLNITYRSLASILKYDYNISDEIEKYTKETDDKGKKRVFKGYYETEKELVTNIKKNVLGNKIYTGEFKTIECQIMDIADDIAYSTYDLEDAFKAGFISPIEMLIQNNDFYEYIANSIRKDSKGKIILDTVDIINILSDLVKFIFKVPLDEIFEKKFNKQDFSVEEYLFLGQQYSNKYNQFIINNGYVRRDFTSQLIESSVANIGVKEIPLDLPVMAELDIEPSTKIRIEILKRVAFLTQVLSPKLKANEHRGKKIVEKIFEAVSPEGGNFELLPKDIQIIYKQKNDLNHQYRTVCDFIACMTDKYAYEFYERVISGNQLNIYKPYY